LVTFRDVQGAITNLSGLIQSWHRILKVARSPDNEELQKTSEEIKSIMLTTNGSLDDLQDSITMATSQPERFSVGVKELKTRQNFVNKARKVIQEIDSTISDPQVLKNAIGSKSSHIIEMDTFKSQTEEQDVANGTELSAQNQLIIEQQDQQLDSILGTVQNLKDIAYTVGTELDDHREMLEEIDLRMDSSQDKLGSAMQKMRAIAERTQNMKSSYLVVILIIVLSLLALVLFFA